jgi:L-alanine-DL-glutamate epimerase-like enolase superfamily enzyme
MSEEGLDRGIEAIDWFRCRLCRKERFVIATGASKETTNVLVRVRSDNLEGWGAVAPNTVTGETSETIERFLSEARARLIGFDPRDIPTVHMLMEALARANPAAMAGVDLAVHDLVGKMYDAPVCELLGRQKESIETSMTIGIADYESTIRRARSSVESGFKVLKLKVGLDVEEDVRRIRGVREVVGENVRLRIDCNQGYSLSMAKRVVKELEPLSIEFIEQPVLAQDWEGLRELTVASSIPIMADEAVKTPEDAERLVDGGYADMLNLKLMKCGGIYPAVRIAKICEEGGVRIMVGCMAECQAAIAGGLHFALSQEIVDHADLDSHFSFLNDPTKALVCVDGKLYPRECSGLGTSVDLVALLLPFPWP